MDKETYIKKLETYNKTLLEMVNKLQGIVDQYNEIFKDFKGLLEGTIPDSKNL